MPGNEPPAGSTSFGLEASWSDTDSVERAREGAWSNGHEAISLVYYTAFGIRAAGGKQQCL